MIRSSSIVLACAALAACLAKHAAPATDSTTPGGATAEGGGSGSEGSGSGSAGGTTAPRPGRNDFTQTTLPKGLTLFHDTLVWSDVAGAIWTMPSDGSKPAKQLSNQHREGFAFHPFVAGERVFAKTKKDLLAISVPDGPVTHAGITGLPDLPEEAVADGDAVYVTIFQHQDVLRIPAAGGAAQHLLDAQRAVLAQHGDTLYVASYSTGTLLAVPKAGGAPRTVARSLAKPTALAADDQAVYVYTEDDQSVSRIDLATGKSAVLGDHLVNSDELVVAGDALYTVSWPNRLVQLATTPGTPPATLAEDLDMPRSIVVDDHFVYVTSSSPLRIVRIARR